MSERISKGDRQDSVDHNYRLGQTASTDTNDVTSYNSRMHPKYPPAYSYHHSHSPKHQPYSYRGMPPSYPPPHHGRHISHGYPYSTPHQRGTSSNTSRLQSVVTSSFSMEDEREDNTGNRNYYLSRPLAQEERHPLELNSNRENMSTDNIGAMRDAQQTSGNREPPPPPMFESRSVNASMAVRVPPSPGDSIQESPRMSTDGPPKVTPEVLKRSFWHHSHPADSRHQPVAHPAFAPPKRVKVVAGRKEREIFVTPRTPMEAEDLGRSNSWAGPEEDMHRHYHQANSFPTPWQSPPPHLRHQPSSYGGYPEPPEDHPPYPYSRNWSTEEVARSRTGAFRAVSARNASRTHPPPYPSMYPNHNGGHSYPPLSHSWSRGSEEWHLPQEPWNHSQYRDDVDSRDMGSRSFSREMSWDDRDPRHRTYEPHSYPYYNRSPELHHKGNPAGPPEVMASMTSFKVDESMEESPPSYHGTLTLLAQPEDKISLSETLCTIRENIEVFTATKTDVEAPAPGRKHPVSVGQVGLRCIHCRHTTKSSDRVKRAVCYPSSIKRIYRTVIDMKLDHFAHCRFVPKSLKSRLEELKAINTRSTGTTMQYFVRAAAKMGMVDGTSGVRLAEADSNVQPKCSPPPAVEIPRALKLSPGSSPNSPPIKALDFPTESSDISTHSPIADKSIHRNDSDNSEFSSAVGSEDSVIEGDSLQIFMGKTTLALPEDKMALSQLRCFLRENVYAFAASDEDIAVRTPTTFSVVVGQVGIGCVHCHSLPAKERSNRAVCFPFAINRIYQSVADIQRFHLGECKMVPMEIREKFQLLQSASSKGSKGLATRQYWITSAKKLGLADTTKGIRFIRDPLEPTSQAVSLDILAQVASNVTTVDRPLVLPEDKPFIAEFLYAVMEQLQPCRFTEADRNKRRLKDVGCIGVECKHCSGQVESRKFFWSSVNAVESNFVSVHTHMMECKMIPPELKENLSSLKQLRKEQTAKLKTGSQKAFFQRVWQRLHHGAQKDAEKQLDPCDEQSNNDGPMADTGLSDHESDLESSPIDMDVHERKTHEASEAKKRDTSTQQEL
jgi:hypothetical protein